jgi:hypothetical protein
MHDELAARHRTITLRLSPELERTILAIRRRLQAHASPTTRYSLIGAGAIRAELKRLGVWPLPCERTIERVMQRHGSAGACGCRTCPRASWCRPGGCPWRRDV